MRTRFSGSARIALLLLLSPLFPAGSVPAQEPATGTSPEAVVVDAHTGAPLAGVTVRVAGRSLRTGPDGRLRLPPLPDSASVLLERIGYRPHRARAGRLPARIALEPSPVLLAEVAVEAGRRSGPVTGTALAVHAVEADAVRAGAHTSVAEALGGVEGVSVARVGSWGARPLLRGLGGERLTVLVDGNRVNRACAFGMDQGLASVDPATVERVELLLGPGSTLYGSGNMGGVLNVVTRDPPPARPLEGELRAGASTGVPGGFLGATLRLGRGAVDGSLSLDASRYGDYRSPDGEVDGSSLRTATAGVRLGWEPDGARRLELGAQFYEGRDIGWPAMGGGAEIPRQSRRSISLDYGAQLGRGVLDAVAARAYVQRVDHEMLVTMTMARNGMTMRSTTEQRSHSTTTGGRAQLRLRPAPDVHADVGMEATEWAAENSRWTTRSGTEPLELRTWPAVSILDVGAFLQGEAEVGGGAVASAGVRLDRVLRDAEGWPSGDEWVASGNAGVRLRLPAEWSARLSAGWGYRVPDPTELYGLALRPDGFVYRGNPGLGTETNRNLEGTLGRDGARLSGSATVFRNDLHDLIAPVLVPGDTLLGRPVRGYENVAEARLEGVSGSARWSPTSWARLSGTISYTRGEDARTGEPLPAVPPLEATLAVRFLPGAGNGGWLEVEGVAAGRQTRAARAAGEPETPGYGVLNVRGGLTLAGARLVLGVDNLLDRAYRGHLDPVRLIRPGRGFYVRLVRSFGG